MEGEALALNPGGPLEFGFPNGDSFMPLGSLFPYLGSGLMLAGIRTAVVPLANLPAAAPDGLAWVWLARSWR